MRKKIFVISSALIILLVGAFYFVGSYFVDFALKRDNNTDPKTPPPATANIADPNLKAPPVPNFKHEIWTIESFDGLQLHATYFEPAEKNHRWAILVHGYGRDQRFAFDYAEEYLKHGYNVLTPDLRASGTSDGTYLTMGAYEGRDVAEWAKKISERDPQAKIVLHGVSMGAATVMICSALEPENVVAVVEDCGYTNAYDMFTAQLEKIFGLPEFPVMYAANSVCKIKTGVYISDAAPVESVTKTKVPTMFIHGNEDKLVPYEMLQKLYDASNAPEKEIWTVEGAGHADAKSKDPSEYFRRVFNFIDKYVS